MNKRKFVDHDDDDENLTLNRGRVNFNSSSLKHCRSIQSTSYEFNSKREVSRKWSYSSRDFSGFEGVENALKHRYLYHNISPKILSWDHRRTVICKELEQYNASILCFQEVDRFNDLQVILHQDGYEGVLKARTGDACDGCAIFWRKERFVLLHEEHIDFRGYDLRDNVAQFCVLKTADGCRRLLVGNIHVLYNPKRGDIKLGQVRLYLEKAYKLSQQWGEIPVVLSGDWNSYPQSAVYQYISSGKLEILQHDRRNISGQINSPRCFKTFHSFSKESYGQMPLVHEWNDEELKLATGSGAVTSLQHNLKLHSAYVGVQGNTLTRDDIGEPLGTTCHSMCMGTVDYIWHSGGLVPFRVLETFPKNVLGKMGGILSEKWGSDHLAVVCDFAFVDDGSEE
ncbi:hypothetical protein RND81_13G086100 [Saponaria officinalis]|uniref:Endonuclease/exonuclease/phosphatase domain-containing protein n=1 Tax=Saponaria officinalis TaxID=3572 RepID=A0AAW1H3W8_SAPOF